MVVVGPFAPAKYFSVPWRWDHGTNARTSPGRIRLKEEERGNGSRRNFLHEPLLVPEQTHFHGKKRYVLEDITYFRGNKYAQSEFHRTWWELP